LTAIANTIDNLSELDSLIRHPEETLLRKDFFGRAAMIDSLSDELWRGKENRHHDFPMERLRVSVHETITQCYNRLTEQSMDETRKAMDERLVFLVCRFSVGFFLITQNTPRLTWGWVYSVKNVYIA